MNHFFTIFYGLQPTIIWLSHVRWSVHPSVRPSGNVLMLRHVHAYLYVRPAKDLVMGLSAHDQTFAFRVILTVIIWPYRSEKTSWGLSCTKLILAWFTSTVVRHVLAYASPDPLKIWSWAYRPMTKPLLSECQNCLKTVWKLCYFDIQVLPIYFWFSRTPFFVTWVFFSV